MYLFIYLYLYLFIYIHNLCKNNQIKTIKTVVIVLMHQIRLAVTFLYRRSLVPILSSPKQLRLFC